ncbi:MAG: hypothetical protein QGG36_29675, partial [Pirellulaceae bacterium]|nr:hypothetical protein [Pirellulaceae bacterium]
GHILNLDAVADDAQVAADDTAEDTAAVAEHVVDEAAAIIERAADAMDTNSALLTNLYSAEAELGGPALEPEDPEELAAAAAEETPVPLADAERLAVEELMVQELIAQEQVSQELVAQELRELALQYDPADECAAPALIPVVSDETATAADADPASSEASESDDAQATVDETDDRAEAKRRVDHSHAGAQTRPPRDQRPPTATKSKRKSLQVPSFDLTSIIHARGSRHDGDK